MSKINALEFGKYVENCKDTLQDIVNNKTNIKVSNKDSLSKIVLNVQNIQKDDTLVYDYVAEPYFQQLIDAYKTDPELIENGGQYEYCSYSVILDKYDTTAISLTSMADTKIVFSDGTIYENTENREFIHTWTSEATDTLSDGRKVRFVKIYTSNTQNYRYIIQTCLPSLDIPTVNNKIQANYTNCSPVVFILNNGMYAFCINDSSVTTNRKSAWFNGLFWLLHLEYYYIGEKAKYSTNSVNTNSGGYVMCCPNLQCINAEHIISLNRVSSTSLIYYCKSLEYINLKFFNDTTTSYNFNIGRDLSIKYVNPDICKNTKYIEFDGLFAGTRKYYILGNNTNPTSTYLLTNVPKSAITSFALTDIMSNNGYQIFTRNCVKNLMIPNNYNNGLNLSYFSLLTKNSWQNIFDNLADLSDLSSKTIILPFFGEYTNDMIQEAVSKNWTVSISTQYSNAM